MPGLLRALFYGAGTYADVVTKSSGAVAGGVARAASHAVVGCVQSASAGGSCGSGAASAGISTLTPDFNSFERNLAARAATGAVTSAITGGNAGQGAVIAAFGYLFNDFSHRAFSPPSLPQGVVDFSAGLGDAILLGQGERIRDFLNISGGINTNSDAYSAGEWGGIALSFGTGFVGGVRVAGIRVAAAEGEARIQAGSLKEFKSLVNQLSKPSSELTVRELRQLESLTEQFGGKLRYDFNPVKGRILQPHVQVEGLGKSVESRHIWLGKGVK